MISVKAFKRILRDAYENNGIESVAEFIERTGIPQGTYYDHMRNGDWTMPELIKIFKVANFSNEQILKVFGRVK